jgi:hypothetical protein
MVESSSDNCMKMEVKAHWGMLSSACAGLE